MHTNLINMNMNMNLNHHHHLASLQSKNLNPLPINQQQIQNFYRQRQQHKQSLSSTQTPIPYFSKSNVFNNLNNEQFKPKNVYRRKSLMNRVNNDESQFSSFNNSMEFSRNFQVENDLKKSLRLDQMKLQEKDFGQDQRKFMDTYSLSKQNFNKKQGQHLNNSQQSPNIIINSTINDKTKQEQSSQTYFQISRRRCNSVQLSNYSTTKIANIKSNTTFQANKKTIPLSSILKKYQQQVKKIQIQKQMNEKQLDKQQESHNKQNKKQNINSSLPQKQIVNFSKKKNDFNDQIKVDEKVLKENKDSINVQKQDQLGKKPYLLKQDLYKYDRSQQLQENKLSIQKISKQSVVNQQLAKPSFFQLITTKSSSQLPKVNSNHFPHLSFQSIKQTLYNSDTHIFIDSSSKYPVIRQYEQTTILNDSTSDMNKQNNKFDSQKVHNPFQTQHSKQKQQSYLKKINQQAQHINKLQKQMNQYKKFVESIRKMKKTLDKMDKMDKMDDNTNKRLQEQKSRQISKKQQQNFNMNNSQVNLKQLWRWIKTLPLKPLPQQQQQKQTKQIKLLR